tara:strand:- start:75 stop:977 length:903 start_codon:yes stop_codon:yes gene_type:complete
MFTKKTSLIIPTRNRHEYLIKLLKYLNTNKIEFKEILIIDSSDKSSFEKTNNYCSKYKKIKIIKSIPSTSLQRNVGIKRSSNKSKYILFLDDDIIFYKMAFYEMNKFITNNKQNNISGFAFNLTSKKERKFFKLIKEIFIFEKIGFYSSKPGKVLENGWHTQIENLKKNTFVEWIYSGAILYVRDKIKNKNFDIKFGKYCYLEDLDFSYNLTRKGEKILVVSRAKFLNPNYVNRSSFSFGKKEILNRYLIVKKYKLNKIKFLISANLRLLISFLGIIKLDFKLLFRSFGNLFAIIKILNG